MANPKEKHNNSANTPGANTPGTLQLPVLVRVFLHVFVSVLVFAALVGCIGEVEGRSIQATKSYVETLEGTTASFEMVPVPAGAMPDSTGAPAIPTSGFWLSATEIPWDVYDVYVFGLDKTAEATAGSAAAAAAADAVAKPSKPYVLPGDAFGHAGFPALGMTARAAEHFVEWLSAKTGRAYRLLTEAEWEYACGLATAEAALDDAAWHKGNADGSTHPVGEKAGGLEIHDMLGNASEWVRGRDGQPVVKGGSYRDAPAEVTCKARRVQTKAWNMTDPQLPKSTWWLSDGHFVTMRVARGDCFVADPSDCSSQ